MNCFKPIIFTFITLLFFSFFSFSQELPPVLSFTTEDYNADHATISSEALPTGVYFAQLENDAKSTKTIRLIKN
ncbi:MAG: hypothetical protein ACPHVL_00885 [Psychroflexus salarius]